MLYAASVLEVNLGICFGVYLARQKLDDGERKNLELRMSHELECFLVLLLYVKSLNLCI